ncbi:hypothetical protein E2986_05391 [Frieseomelitta varia]|uniref:Uncharacterized protein n=1 Tax=Frieseomelitta varia TaxID=561572 RepID=A0A833S5V3_9HYME|nr:zinc finger protein 658B-like [Frieseomelitta varia]KAF3423802.1 hypothetical protein E2986_05391 [Frieseomelitta varia]
MSTMDEVVELQDMENVCRLCLSTDEPKLSVFETEDSLLSMASKIQACLSIQISTTDKLSTQICAQCVKNVNQWHSYKETCLSSQEKLHQWLERQHMQQSPMVVTIKDEPVDLDFYEDNIEIISESTTDSNLEVTNLEENTNHLEDSAQKVTDGDEVAVDEDQPVLMKDVNISIKPELQDDYDTDCTIEIESVTGNELVANPLASSEERIMEADSTQKSNASASANKKKARRGPHTHFRGARIFKQKCVHCQINLHSKHSYAKHMQRFHTDKQNGSVNKPELKDEEELVEDLEDELMSMEKDAPLTQVQQNIIGQLKTFSCYSCQQSFSDRRSTLFHIRQHMPDLRPHTCIACLTEFPDRSMYKLHCGASFECAMKIALVVPKQGEEKYFTCNMCLRPMQNRKQLLSHLSKHSDKQYEQLVSPTRFPPKLKPVTPLPPLKQESRKRASEENYTLNIPNPYKNGDPAHNHICDLCGMIYRYKPNMLRHRDLCLRLSSDVRTSYRCVHCGMTYLVFKKFHSHITQEHKKKDLICSECGSKFKSPSNYLEHREGHRINRAKKHSLDPKSDLTKIPQNISNKDWDTFEAEVNAKKLSDSNQYSCALCNLEFTTRAELTEHRNLHLKVKIYSCVICRSMFSSAGALEIHMKDHGIEDPNERNANSSCLEYGTVEEESKDSNSMNVSATSDPGDKKNECNTCGKIFSNSANLKRHIRNLHNVTRGHLSCSYCWRTFKSKETHDRHVTIDHLKSSKSMLRCSRCPKTFFFQANLNLHFETTHAEKSFPVGHKCDICGKTFMEETSLKIHRSWHNRANSRLSLYFMKKEDPKQEEPLNSNTTRPARARKSYPNSPSTKPNGNFQCQVCSEKFNDVTELRTHLWDVHCARSKNEKNFPDGEFNCELCMNVFPDKETLDMHLQWHKAQPILNDITKSDYTCDICGKSYSSKKILSRHKKLHKSTIAAAAKLQSAGKNLASSQASCTVCHKVFNNNRLLQCHRLNVHSNIFNQQSQQVQNNKRRSSQEEPRAKRIKLEQEDRQTPSAMDAMSAGKKSVMCHVCRKFFANMSVLYKHKQLVHKTHANLVKNFSKSYQMECIPLPSNDGKVSCNVCYKKFPGVSNLRQHFTVKHKNAPVKYACTVDGCKLTFPTPMILKNHEMSHTSIIFSCNLCNRHVFNRPAMSNHILTVHNIVYNAENSKNFHRELDLGKYVVEGAVDATCPQCKIKYPNNRAMKIHYFKYHENPNE